MMKTCLLTQTQVTLTVVVFNRIQNIAFTFFLLLSTYAASAAFILVPMDSDQKNHLKAYGIAFWSLEQGIELEWLLNYRGGSFLIPNTGSIGQECNIRGVSYEVIADAQAAAIREKMAQPDINQEAVKLHKVPKIAVYSPDGKQPWDDAVTLVLAYAEIPYERIYDKEIIENKLPLYDWLHLHHEDFTGQYGRFYASFKNAAWYQQQVRNNEAMATSLGFSKVSELKRNVAVSIQNFVLGGGYVFTMCSGTDSYDIALSAINTDICEAMFDGDGSEPGYQKKLDFDNTLAFKDFTLEDNPNVYEFSNIDATPLHTQLGESNDYFSLFEFSAKWDVVPTMLTQSHERVVKGFMGQTTSFNKNYIKPSVIVLGETKSINAARYIHGTLGKGQWTFYGGHDPADYRHMVGDPPTDLNLHPNSAGYRLILNNVLFPAARKRKQKT